MPLRYSRLKTFTRRQERALVKSIEEKWKLLVRPDQPEDEPDCACCDAFFDSGPDKMICEGCPIAIVSGRAWCEGTPYTDWAGTEHGTDDELRHARRELRFLKTLLKKGREVREKNRAQTASRKGRDGR